MKINKCSQMSDDDDEQPQCGATATPVCTLNRASTKPRQLFRKQRLQAPRALSLQPRSRTEMPSSSTRIRREQRPGAPRIVDAKGSRHRKARAYDEIRLGSA